MSDMQKSPLNMGGHQVTNSADPTNLTDLVTKRYADQQVPSFGAGVPSGDPVNPAIPYYFNVSPSGAGTYVYYWNGSSWTGIL